MQYSFQHKVALLLGCFASGVMFQWSGVGRSMMLRLEPIERIICNAELPELDRRIQKKMDINADIPDPNSHVPLPKMTPLTLVFSPHCKSGAFHALLSAGADPNKADRSGQRPLEGAVSSGDLRAISWLLQRGADLNALDSSGKTVLMKLFSNNTSSLHMARFLMALGADNTLRDPAGLPVWTYAEKNEWHDLARVLKGKVPEPK
jgi:ankyrin repeat protein